MTWYKAFVVLLALLLLARPAHAQHAGGVEIGADGGIRRELTDPQATITQFPLSRIRAGVFVSPTISLEPAVRLTYFSTNGTSDAGADFLVGVLFHFQPDHRRAQPYVRPFVEFTHSSLSLSKSSGEGQSESLNETALGAGLGIKVPLTSALSTRFEGAFDHTLEQGVTRGRNAANLLIGLSYFIGH